MGRKLTFKHVKDFINKTGYKLISTEYINSIKKLTIQCPKKHVFQMRYNDFHRGIRCPRCFGTPKHRFEYIKETIEDKGYDLISTEYINSMSKLTIQCPKKHVFQMRYNDFHRGQRCPVCSGKQKHSFEYVKNLIESTGYDLISTEYINSMSKLTIQCPKKHVFQMRFKDFYQGQRCPVCSGNQRLTFEYVKNFIEKEGYKLISTEYINSSKKLKIQCPCGDIYNVKFNDFQQGKRCPICVRNQTSSKAEKEILEYIKSIYEGTILPNDRTQVINPLTGNMLELDIYLPELNKAIEYNGVYWHSMPIAKKRDLEKIKQCKEKGISLLVIKEEDWCNNKDFSIIKEFLS